MKTVTSKDGTTIAFDQSGKGPAIILVGGMFEQRAMDSETAQLAALPLLAQHFTVFHYDRRGRGDSTDTQPYAVEREIEDIEALINEAGGLAFVFGISSGAALAFEAALALGGKVKKLAMYEAPYNDDDDARRYPPGEQPVLLCRRSSWTAVRVNGHLCTSRQWRLQTLSPMHSTAPWKVRRIRSLRRHSLLCW